MAQHNLFGSFKIYPRGFLGAPVEPVLSKQRRTDNRLTYDTTVFDANDSRLVTANQKIDEYYAAFVRRDGFKGADFDFREKALHQILHAFGTQDFNEWYAAQFKSPSFGELHRRFLDDTLKFIRTGQRELDLSTWVSLLTPADSRDTDIYLSLRAKTYFNVSSVGELLEPGAYRGSLVETVQDWLSKDGGFSDLLVTCHILFGLPE